MLGGLSCLQCKPLSLFIYHQSLGHKLHKIVHGLKSYIQNAFPSSLGAYLLN